MKRHELSLYDFEAINMALENAARRARVIRDDAERSFGPKDKLIATLNERIERLEKLREMFEVSHTGWLEIEDALAPNQ